MVFWPPRLPQNPPWIPHLYWGEASGGHTGSLRYIGESIWKPPGIPHCYWGSFLGSPWITHCYGGNIWGSAWSLQTFPNPPNCSRMAPDYPKRFDTCFHLHPQALRRTQTDSKMLRRCQEMEPAGPKTAQDVSRFPKDLTSMVPIAFMARPRNLDMVPRWSNIASR